MAGPRFPRRDRPVAEPLKRLDNPSRLKDFRGSRQGGHPPSGPPKARVSRALPFNDRLTLPFRHALDSGNRLHLNCDRTVPER